VVVSHIGRKSTTRCICKWGDGVEQAEIHVAEPLIPEISAFVAEINGEHLRTQKCSRNGETSVELRQTRGEMLGPIY
jgi:hypothetical protein